MEFLYKIKEGIKLLKQIITENEKLGMLIVQSARYSDIVKKIHLGIVEDTVANIEKNKIRFALINLAMEIEEQTEKNPSLIKTDSSISINQTHSGTGDNVAGDKIINE